MVIKSSTSVKKFDQDTDSSSHATLVTIYWRNNFFQSISDYYILVQWIILFQLNTVLRKFDLTASKEHQHSIQVYASILQSLIHCYLQS